MSNKLLLDTSVIIDFLRQKDKANTLLYKLSLEDSDLYASIITHAELYAGKSVWERQDAKSELETIFEGLEILSLTEDISKKAGQIKSSYGTDLIDAIIAATAMLNKMPLATLNTKHFEGIAGLEVFRE